MNAYQLPYLSLFRGCIILRCVRFFLIFSLNYQQGVTRCCIRIDKWEEITKSSLQTNQKQTYIYLDLEKVHRLKGLTFPYIISYLHFLNLNNILTHPQTLVVAEAGFSLTRMMFALFFACQIYTHACYFTKSKQMQAVYRGAIPSRHPT